MYSQNSDSSIWPESSVSIAEKRRRRSGADTAVTLMSQSPRTMAENSSKSRLPPPSLSFFWNSARQPRSVTCSRLAS